MSIVNAWQCEFCKKIFNEIDDEYDYKGKIRSTIIIESLSLYTIDDEISLKDIEICKSCATEISREIGRAIDKLNPIQVSE